MVGWDRTNDRETGFLSLSLSLIAFYQISCDGEKSNFTKPENGWILKSIERHLRRCMIGHLPATKVQFPIHRTNRLIFYNFSFDFREIEKRRISSRTRFFR